MVIFENLLLKICFLAIYSAQSCFGHYHTPPQQDCIDEIHNVFHVLNLIPSPNPLKPPRHPTRKHFAVAAYLNFRIPKPSNLFAESTFIDKKNKKTYKDAQAYYEHILEPGHLLKGPFMKLPKKFCEEKQRRRFIGKPKGIDTIFNACMGQLAQYQISLADDELEVIKSIYENVVIGKVKSEDTYALEFIQKNEKGFQAVPPMLLPQQFCMEKHPRVLEHPDDTYRPFEMSTS